MAVNQYFKQGFGENEQDQNLMQELTTELIQRAGFDCFYIPRKYVNEDKLYGEDQSSQFSRTYTIEFRPDPMDQWGGESDLLSKFGIEDFDEATIWISKQRFKEEITSDDTDIIEPREGDLVKMPATIDRYERLYEISHVKEEGQFYQYGGLYSYEINIRVFAYGGEDFEGNDDLDEYERDFANKTIIQTSGFTDQEPFFEGETVSNPDGSISGIVYSYNDDTGELQLYHVKGNNLLKEKVQLRNQTGSQTMIDSVGSKTEGTYSDNDFLEENRDDVLTQFNKNNPFGE